MDTHVGGGLHCVGRGDWWPWDLDPVDRAHWVVIGDDRRSDGTGLRVGCRVWGDANVIQELSRRGGGYFEDTTPHQTVHDGNT